MVWSQMIFKFRIAAFATLESYGPFVQRAYELPHIFRHALKIVPLHEKCTPSPVAFRRAEPS